MRVVRSGFLVVLALLLSCSGNSENGENSGGNNNSSNKNISGRWYVEVISNTNGNKTPYVADIEQSDSSFTGTIKFGLLYSKNFSGAIRGSVLDFSSSDDTLHFEGSVVVDDSVAGTWKNVFTQDSGTWYAIRPGASYNWNGNFTGEIYIINFPNADTVSVSDGVWKLRTLKGAHQDTVFVAGELLAHYGADTISLNVPAGGWIYGDSLFIDASCIISGAQGELLFRGLVVSDSVNGQWGITPVSGMTPAGQGSFSGYIGN